MDKLSLYLTRKQLPLKQIFPQSHSVTLTFEYQIKLAQYSVEQETIPPSQKEDCRPILVHFENYHLSNFIDDEKEKILSKPLDSFSFEAVEPVQI